MKYLSFVHRYHKSTSFVIGACHSLVQKLQLNKWEIVKRNIYIYSLSSAAFFAYDLQFSLAVVVGQFLSRLRVSQDGRYHPVYQGEVAGLAPLKMADYFDVEGVAVVSVVEALVAAAVVVGVAAVSPVVTVAVVGSVVAAAETAVVSAVEAVAAAVPVVVVVVVAAAAAFVFEAGVVPQGPPKAFAAGHCFVVGCVPVFLVRPLVFSCHV